MRQLCSYSTSTPHLLHLAIRLPTPSLIEFLFPKLVTNVGPGPEGLINRFFVNCKQYIATLCFKECYFPHLCLALSIIPILKSGDFTLTVKYEYISSLFLLQNSEEIRQRLADRELL